MILHDALTIVDWDPPVQEDGNVSVEGITIYRSEIPLTVGQKEILHAAISPVNASNKAVDWSTDDAAIATVENGLVTAVAEGETKIKATTREGGFVAECTVKV